MSWLTDVVSTLFSGIGVKFLFREKSVKIDSPPITINNCVNVNTESDLVKGNQLNDSKRYAGVVGARHKKLREDILGISIREMALFYGLHTVSELVDYEEGSKELPQWLIADAIEFFSLRSDFFDVENTQVFTYFGSSQSVFETFIDNGYRPIIACEPYLNEDRLCRFVFFKTERNVKRIVLSSALGSFNSSSGGGRGLILDLIKATRAKGLTPESVRVVKTIDTEWNDMQYGRFYDNQLFSRFGVIDRENTGIYLNWFFELEKHQEQNCI
ncbi:hypothetical protein [Salinivibrio kushneri]|uniref:hypothetical protein n=1 Tax=Salinivibrio kushneri TaxID=1908198 RepID=UPI0009887177|nr:hypothetical protein [Salinivibrio kushneri]OOE54560.1 hypothetical protein BZG12_05900 [Salinivibrio kushneri]